MPLILSGNVASATGGYNVANSCRFNNGSSDYLNKSVGGNSTLNTKGTWSTWVKKSNTGSSKGPLFSGYADASNRVYLVINSDAITVFGKVGGTVRYTAQVDQNNRDPSAWMNIVVAIDTTQGTDTNRIKIYINGTIATIGSTNTPVYPVQDTAIPYAATSSYTNLVGALYSTSLSQYSDNYLAETVFIDGLALDATSFGEFDEDSPTIWKPKDVSELTFGDNGFYLDFEDSANLGNDANGGTDFTVNNLAATDQATDTPTNNFATFNSLTSSLQSGGVVAYSEGNVNIVTSYTDADYLRYPQAYSTMGATAGKWYAEFKPTAMGSAGIGIANTGEFGSDGSTNPFGGRADSGAVYTNSGEYRAGAFADAGGQGTYTTDDIIGVAMDLDNLKLYWHKNGTYINSGDPTTGATGTGARAIVDPATPGGFYVFTAGADNSSVATISGNFGSPPYSISSGNADGNGYGDFEYAPPSGYYALCTKNLGSTGG